MKKLRLNSFKFLFAFLVLPSLYGCFPSWANNPADLQIGDVSYGGTGCPAGSAGIIISPDKTSFFISFDRFIAEAGGNSGRPLDRKSCALAIPVTIPAGYSLSLIPAGIKGFVSLPAGGEGEVNVESFFAGAQGPRLTKTFQGPLEKDFSLTFPDSEESSTYSPCGGTTNLRVNTSVLVKASEGGQNAVIIIDNPDNQGQLFLIKWKQC